MAVTDCLPVVLLQFESPIHQVETRKTERCARLRRGEGCYPENESGSATTRRHPIPPYPNSIPTTPQKCLKWTPRHSDPYLYGSADFLLRSLGNNDNPILPNSTQGVNLLPLEYGWLKGYFFTIKDYTAFVFRVVQQANRYTLQRSPVRFVTDQDENRVSAAWSEADHARMAHLSIAHIGGVFPHDFLKIAA